MSPVTQPQVHYIHTSAEFLLYIRNTLHCPIPPTKINLPSRWDPYPPLKVIYQSTQPPSKTTYRHTYTQLLLLLGLFNHDHDHLRDYLSIRRLILHMVNQRTKFEVSKPFQKYFRGTKNLNGSRDMTMPLSRTVCHPYATALGLAMVNLHTKFEVSMFTHYQWHI